MEDFLSEGGICLSSQTLLVVLGELSFQELHSYFSDA